MYRCVGVNTWSKDISVWEDGERERKRERERERDCQCGPYRPPSCPTSHQLYTRTKKVVGWTEKKKKKLHPSLSYPRGVCERVCNRIENESEETRQSSPSNSVDLVFIPVALSQSWRRTDQYARRTPVWGVHAQEESMRTGSVNR